MPSARNSRTALENLLFRYLGVRSGECLAFVHDHAYSGLASAVRDIAREHNVQCDCLEIDHDGIRPLDGMTADILVGTKYGVILFGTVHNIWHTPERRRAKHLLNKRLASLVCAPDEIDCAASFADVGRISAAARGMQKYFPSGSTVKISTPGGTSVSAKIGIPFCEHGNYAAPGSGGDFPSGEVGFGPQEGSVNGTIVYDIKVQHIGILEEPLILQVEKDRIVNISGNAADRFEAICAERGDILHYISEISIGLNPLAGITPAQAYIPEEKTFGTLHCGHGGNESYGNRHGPHFDGVMARPTLEIDGRLLMDDGKIQTGLIEETTLQWLTNPE